MEEQGWQVSEVAKETLLGVEESRRGA